MRISAPTFTQTPNDLFDHWLPKLCESELKVLMIILRKTFGWHKTRDYISISMLAKKTGMMEETVIIATKSLQKKGLILKEVIGPKGKQQTYYELIVEENSNNSYPSDQPRGPLGLDGGGQSEAQKKASIKETNDDDDIAHTRAEKPKEKDPNILITKDPKGNEKSSCKIGLINYLRDNRYSEAVILEALIRTESTIDPISNVLKYVETICLQLQSQNAKKPTYNQKTKGNNSWKQSKYQHKQFSQREDMNHSSKQSQISKEKTTALDTSEHPFQTWPSRLKTNKQQLIS